MKCQSVEDLICFALDPIHCEKEEIVTHIMGCISCQNELRIINEIIICHEDATWSDIQEIKNVLWKRKINALFNKTPIADALTDSIDEIESDSFMPNFDFLTGIAALTSVNISAPYEEYSGEPAKIVFAADCGENAFEYWNAEILIPPGTRTDSTLVILLTDKNNKVIESGTFVLLGNELPIHDGIAEITLSTFRDSLKNTNVFLRMENGKEITGGLAIC